MTEDDAKTKWCPFVRLISDTIDGKSFSPTFNRMVSCENPEITRTPTTGNCIGSKCMAWRWNEPTCRNKKEGTIHTIKMLDGEWGEGYERMPDTGYCGLAGKP